VSQMRRQLSLLTTAATALLFLIVTSHAHAAKSVTIPASAADSKPASLFTPDKGTFRILVNGQQVGKEEFDISLSGGNWVAHDVSEIQGAGGTTKISGTLELHPDGTPQHYEWSTQGAKKASAAIGFEGPTATIDLHVEGAKPYTQQFTFTSPQVVILDNNLYYQYAVLAGLYDWDKKGTQTFSVLVPQELTPGSVTVESAGTQDASGKKLEELAVKTPDLEVDLFLDGHRLVRIVAPSTNAEILRDK
jgi:hypothetical protein